MAVPNWSRAHMAAYKRLATVQMPHRSIHCNTHQCQLTNRITIFSLMLVRSKNHNIIQLGWRTWSSQRFNNGESSSLSYFSLQFQREFTARSSKLKRDHRDASEKKRERIPRVPNRFSEGKKKKNENSRIPNHSRRRRKHDHGLISGFQSQIQQQNQFKDLWGSKSNLRNKTR